MHGTRVSVIVVSRHRSEALHRCVTALAQLDDAGFELIIVADPEAVSRLRQRPDAATMKLLVFDQANIAQARNLGVAHAAGDVVAFVDDDAVPEPTWLARLTAPFEDPEISATGGFVRGRNGVSFQWCASSVDAAGRRYPRRADEVLPTGHAWRTEGTNMAFRRTALLELGGFDPRFHFFLEETDVNRRLQGRTLIVPEAEVHHGFAPSARRRGDRVPRDLFHIGASSAHFLAKHAPEEASARLDEIRLEQRNRLLRHMVAGRLEPRDLRCLLQRLEEGITTSRNPDPNGLCRDLATGFVPWFSHAPGPKVVLSGRWRDQQTLMNEAMRAVSDKKRPTIIISLPSLRYMQVKYVEPGAWLHVGGVFGKAERTDTMITVRSSKSYFERELARISDVRGIR